MYQSVVETVFKDHESNHYELVFVLGYLQQFRLPSLQCFAEYTVVQTKQARHCWTPSHSVAYVAYVGLRVLLGLQLGDWKER